MDKNKILIVILATILAFIVGISIIKYSSNQKELNIKDNNPEQVLLNENETQEVEQEDVAVDEKDVPTLEPIDKEVAKKDIENIRKSVENSKKQIVQEEKKEVNIESKVEVTDDLTSKNIEDAGIIKEIETNEIVITREFKVQSPSKYSFK